MTCSVTALIHWLSDHPGDAPSWIQAVGSVAAIWFSGRLFANQRQNELRDLKEERNRERDEREHETLRVRANISNALMAEVNSLMDQLLRLIEDYERDRNPIDQNTLIRPYSGTLGQLFEMRSSDFKELDMDTAESLYRALRGVRTLNADLLAIGRMRCGVPDTWSALGHAIATAHALAKQLTDANGRLIEAVQAFQRWSSASTG